MNTSYTVVAYPVRGPNIMVGTFNVPSGSSDDKIITAAKGVIGKSFGFKDLPVDRLNYQIDSHKRYVHILDRVNVNWSQSSS